MREICFRGKSIATGKWVEGFLIVNKDGTCFIKDTDYNVNNGKNDLIPVEVEPSSIGQYCGLLDKNGKRIFENDVCTFYNRYSKSTYTRVVRFCPLLACFGLYPNMTEIYEYESDWLKISDVEIIGNIHDNPELLNQ